MRLVVKVIVLIFILNSAAFGQCGGKFSQFLDDIKNEALKLGHTELKIEAILQGVALNPKVLEADRAQAIFLKPFNEFAPRLMSEYRIVHGFNNLKKYSSIFSEIKEVYGVSPGVLASFWALETDFGAVQGNFNTLDALITLAFDCRRPLLFRPQIFAALELFAQNKFDPRTTKGAWAGEIGMVQMLPKDILENGVDADGDGDAVAAGPELRHLRRLLLKMVVVDLGRHEDHLRGVEAPRDVHGLDDAGLVDAAAADGERLLQRLLEGRGRREEGEELHHGDLRAAAATDG